MISAKNIIHFLIWDLALAKVYLLALPFSLLIPWITSYALYGVIKPRHIDASIVLICFETLLGISACIGMPFATLALTNEAQLEAYPNIYEWYPFFTAPLSLIIWHLAKQKRIRADTYKPY